MSNKVLTPNVFITNNYEDIQSFFLNPKKIGSLQDLSTSKGSLLISGKNNKYLQHFELSYNFDSSDTQKLTLEFVDTDGNFEQSFFIYPLDQIKSLLNATYEQEQYIRPQGSNIESKLVDVSEYASQVHRIYVAFGTGPNLREWSDPMAFTLREVKLDISKNGLRKYQFTLYPTNSPLFRPKLIFNFNKPNPDREFFLLNEANPTYIATIPVTQKDTLEIALYKLVKNYLSVLTQTNENNIIGILPKIFPSNNSIINGQTVSIKGDMAFFLYPDPNLLELVLNSYGIQIRSSADAANSFSDAIKLKTGRSVNPDIVRSQIEAISKLKNDIFLQLEAKKINSTINPAFPDFYEPLNKINTTLKSNLNTIDDFVVIQENNSKILKFFKDQGLISDDTSKCIIFGLEAMINEWLYRNYIPDDFTSIKSLEDFATKFSADEDLMEGKEKSILTNKNYGIDYLNFVSRKKLSSAFSENINIDELSYNQKSKEFTDLFKDSENILKLLDIPVFTNNLKNSNILDLSIQNSEVYYNSFRKSIDSNFTRFYLSNIQRNISKLNIKGLQITSVFDNYKKILDQLYNNGDDLTSDGYRKKLKETMILAFYFAREEGRSISGFRDNRRENKKGLAGSDFGRGLLNQTEMEWGEVTTMTSLGGDIKIPYPTFRDKPVITLDQLRAKILKDTDISFTTPEDYEKVLTDNLMVFKDLEQLFIKNGGNINIDSKLFLTQAIINTAYPVDSYSMNSRIPGTSNQIENELETYYQLAGLLTSIFDLELSNAKQSKNDKAPSVVFKPKNLGLGQDNIAAELWRNITEQAYKISIKTLPFFHLSSFRTMVMKPCYLFSKKITVSKTDSKDNNLDFFSGTYNITAFRHVINTKECYSQFLLVKSVGTSFLT